jgi:hypothetical protein
MDTNLKLFNKYDKEIVELQENEEKTEIISKGDMQLAD